MVLVFLQRESLTPGCHGKWLRVEVGAVGNSARGHFNHVRDLSEINGILATLQKALESGKEIQSLSCQQTPVNGSIYRLRGWGKSWEGVLSGEQVWMKCNMPGNFRSPF